MAKRKKTLVCSHCINEFEEAEMYWVNRWMHREDPKHGQYRVPYCEKCLKAKDTYIDVHEPVKKKKSKKK